MRKLVASIACAMMLTFAGIATASADTATPVKGNQTPTTTPVTKTKKDNSGKIGLVGLAGLLGLAGLARRKRNDDDVNRTGRTPGAGSTGAR